MQELERVALVEDLPEYSLKAGDIGMVMHVYRDQQGYEVEFVTLDGSLIGLVSLYPEQIRSLAGDEVASARRVGVRAS
jgi:hypothetical protein